MKNLLFFSLLLVNSGVFASECIVHLRVRGSAGEDNFSTMKKLSKVIKGLGVEVVKNDKLANLGIDLKHGQYSESILTSVEGPYGNSYSTRIYEAIDVKFFRNGFHFKRETYRLGNLKNTAERILKDADCLYK